MGRETKWVRPASVGGEMADVCVRNVEVAELREPLSQMHQPLPTQPTNTTRLKV